MKHLFIINPVAGRKKHGREMADKINAIFADREEEYEIVFTEYPDHATEIAAMAAKSDEPTRIYAIGGDGTLHEVVQGCYHAKNIQIAPVPNGTGNDFVKAFPDYDFTDIEKLVDGTGTVVDLLTCGDNVSLNIINCGFDAQVAGNVNKFKKVFTGSLAYYIALFYTFIQRINSDIVVSVDGYDFYRGKSLLTVAANGRVYGGGFLAAPDARYDDGLIDIVVVKKLSRLKITGFVGKYKSGNHQPLMHLMRKCRGKAITISSTTPFAISFDGEVEMTKEAKIELVEKALTIVLPAGTQRDGM